MLILCRTNITEAFFFSRSRGELLHRALFERLIDFVLTHSQGKPGVTASAELVTLPLDETEESWLEEYLTEGEGRRCQGAADTLLIRAMTTGRFDALQSQSEVLRDRKIDGLNWAKLREGIDRVSSTNELTI